MDGHTFKANREALGADRRSMAKWLGVSARDILSWETKRRPVAPAAAILLMAIRTDGANLRFMLRRASQDNEGWGGARTPHQ
jgi:DNA-binding transcriptional regulator YiaG